MPNILVVDDELGIRDLLLEILEDEGHHVDVAANASEAREFRNKYQPDLVLLDIWMPDTDGVSLLKEWSSNSKLTMPVVMMSGHATIETAIEATKLGARAFLEKPITLQKLLKAVVDALNTSTLGVQYKKIESDQDEKDCLIDSIGVINRASTSDEVASVGMVFSFDKTLREAREEFEQAYFSHHLSMEGGSMTRVAEKSGLERTHLYRKLKQLGIEMGKTRQTVKSD